MKPIPNYENEYTISEDGAITRIETGRILSPSTNPQNGYLYISLWKGNKGRTFSVHRLVATVYIPNPLNKPFVNHIDSVRSNPHKDNLEWATQSENIKHSYEFGHMSQEAKRRFKSFELDMLLQSFLSGLTMTALSEAEECGLSRLTINLRKHAEQTGLISEFKEQLVLQKCMRNRAANVTKRTRISQYSLDGIYLREYGSLTEAASTLGKKSSGSISNALNPNHPQTKAYGYLWKYV